MYVKKTLPRVVFIAVVVVVVVVVVVDGDEDEDEDEDEDDHVYKYFRATYKVIFKVASSRFAEKKSVGVSSIELQSLKNKKIKV